MGKLVRQSFKRSVNLVLWSQLRQMLCSPTSQKNVLVKKTETTLTKKCSGNVKRAKKSYILSEKWLTESSWEKESFVDAEGKPSFKRIIKSKVKKFPTGSGPVIDLVQTVN